MSGVAGGNRIKKENVDIVVNNYINILKKFPKFINYTVSGSSNSNKRDFGDLDLIIQFNGTDKKQIKSELIKFLMELPDDIILPFNNIKYKNKRYYNSSEIITILFPQNKTETVQIDNIIALSKEELNFKKHFLDLPAEKQGLLLGLIKTVLLEYDNQKIFNLCKININTNLNKNEEFEFNLSSSGLELRKVLLSNEFKILKKEVVWKTVNWKYVKLLLSKYNINSSFDELIIDIKSKLYNERSYKRIVGLFNSMVSVKSGEIGTPKGYRKEQSKQIINTLL